MSKRKLIILIAIAFLLLYIIDSISMKFDEKSSAAQDSASILTDTTDSIKEGNETIRYDTIPYNGHFVEYYGDGVLLRKGTMRNGLRHGTVYEYNHDGSLESQTEYRNGIPHGIQKTFYNNGQIASISHYKNGKSEGEYIQYHRNGKIFIKGQNHNGHETGTWTIYDTLGHFDRTHDATPSSNDAYLAGYEDGYDDGCSDAMRRQKFQGDYNMAGNYTGEMAKEYNKGYIDGYSFGYYEIDDELTYQEEKAKAWEKHIHKMPYEFDNYHEVYRNKSTWMQHTHRCH